MMVALPADEHRGRFPAGAAGASPSIMRCINPMAKSQSTRWAVTLSLDTISIPHSGYDQAIARYNSDGVLDTELWDRWEIPRRFQ